MSVVSLELPLGLLETLSTGAQEKKIVTLVIEDDETQSKCSCPNCNLVRLLKSNLLVTKDNELSIPLPHQKQIEQLIKLKAQLAYVQDKPLWEAISKCHYGAYDTLSSFSKEWIRETIVGIRKTIKENNWGNNLPANLKRDLEDNTGKNFLHWIYGNKTIIRTDLPELLRKVKEASLKFLDEKSLKKAREDFNHLLTEIPKEFHNLTEVPKLTIKMTDLETAARQFLASKK